MKTLAMVLAAALSLLAAYPAGAQGLAAAKPEEVGLSSERLARIGAILRDDVERGRIPGVVIMVARRGKLAYVETVGFRDKAAGAPMTRDAIFRIASMTKPMVSVAAMMLYEEGRLLMADPVSVSPRPGQGPGRDREGRSRHRQDGVLHRARRARDDGAGSPSPHLRPAVRRARHQPDPRRVPASSSAAARELTGTEFIDRLAKAPLLHQPGSNWEYGFSSDVLGRVVEVVSGKTLGQFPARCWPIAASWTARDSWGARRWST